jgi:hypothetical protein
MTRRWEGRLARLEARPPRLKGIFKEPSPEVIVLLAEEVIWQLKNETAEPKLRSAIPGLLESEHVPGALKEQLRALWAV